MEGVGEGPVLVSRAEYSAARVQCDDAVAGVARAARAGGVAGERGLRGASGECGVGGVDRGAEKHAIDGAGAACSAGVLEGSGFRVQGSGLGLVWTSAGAVCPWNSGQIGIGGIAGADSDSSGVG